MFAVGCIGEADEREDQGAQGVGGRQEQETDAARKGEQGVQGAGTLLISAFVFLVVSGRNRLH